MGGGDGSSGAVPAPILQDSKDRSFSFFRDFLAVVVAGLMRVWRRSMSEIHQIIAVPQPILRDSIPVETGFWLLVGFLEVAVHVVAGFFEDDRLYSSLIETD